MPACTCVCLYAQSKKPLTGIISERHPEIINITLNIQQKGQPPTYFYIDPASQISV